MKNRGQSDFLRTKQTAFRIYSDSANRPSLIFSAYEALVKMDAVAHDMIVKGRIVPFGRKARGMQQVNAGGLSAFLQIAEVAFG